MMIYMYWFICIEHKELAYISVELVKNIGTLPSAGT